MNHRAHPETGEPCYQHVDHEPRGLETQRQHGVLGRPFRNLLLCRERVELSSGWCFASGHMEHYEERAPEVYRRGAEGWDPALKPALREAFGAEFADEVLARLARGIPDLPAAAGGSA